jgi:hypothetical protein
VWSSRSLLSWLWWLRACFFIVAVCLGNSLRGWVHLCSIVDFLCGTWWDRQSLFRVKTCFPRVYPPGTFLPALQWWFWCPQEICCGGTRIACHGEWSCGRSVQANIEYLYIRSYGQTASVTSNLRVYSRT